MHRTLRSSLSACLLLAMWGCGDNANLGLNALVDTRTEPPGDNCPTGGIAIATGMDENRNGTLDDAEVAEESFLCNGQDGTDGQNGTDGTDGTGSLLRVDQEPPGRNCPFGGLAVHAGIDSNRDGVLSYDEITDTKYVCNEDPGRPGTTAGFTWLSRVPGVSSAEIIAVSPDARWLAYTSATSAAVGFVDISDPGRPRLMGQIDVSSTVSNAGAGEPTSVAITPNGQYALIAVKDTMDPIANSDPGSLVFVDPTTLTIAGIVPVGIGPDSVAIAPTGMRAVVAIEDEEDTDRAATNQQRPGSVQIVTIDYASPASSTVVTVPLMPDVGNNLMDPQPEYVDITYDGRTAIVSLQENNAVAVIDLEAAEVLDYIDAGLVERHYADIFNDGEIVFDHADIFTRREPDAVCLLSDGMHFVTANEGDTETNDFVVGQWSGSRGFSIFSIDGEVVYDVGDDLERLVMAEGVYPDGRSDDRGIEVEGCEVASFDTRELAFLLLERSGMVAVYDVTRPDQPALVQFLPSPLRPESTVALPRHGLVAVAGEGTGIGDGGIWLYRAVSRTADVERYPSGVHRAVSSHLPTTPFASISAMAATNVPGRVIAVPDDSFATQRLWTFDSDPVAQRMRLVDEIRLTAADGVTPISGYDPQGVAVNPYGGFVLAVAGARDNGCNSTGCAELGRNRLLFFDDSGALDPRYGNGGIVDLPSGSEANSIDWTRLPSSAFGGVELVAGAGSLRAYVVFQRPLDAAGTPDEEVLLNYARIGEYDVISNQWRFFYYPVRRNLDGSRGEIYLTDIAHLGGNSFAVIERDRRRGDSAAIKMVYAFELSSATANDVRNPLDKRPVVDLLDLALRFDYAEIDALAAAGGSLWLANDNDGGAEATFFYEVTPSAMQPMRSVRFATFNVSLNRNATGELSTELATPDSMQPKVIAEIIQRAAPDVVLLNEFDYDPAAPELAPRLFQQNYLGISQNGASPIVYPYFYVAPVNTGVASGVDLDGNGRIGTSGADYANDAFGFGLFPGQYGMVVYSKYPIDTANIRTFQNFRWVDMPGALLPDNAATPEPGDFYSPEALAVFRLSSKSHWDVPIRVGSQVIHILASHPTPPVFDGPEDRNGARNHDEIRFWADYVNSAASAYIYDDNGTTGGLPAGASFVIMGDLNADPVDGDQRDGAILQLLAHPLINAESPPANIGGIEQARLGGGANATHRGNPAFDTADFADTSPGNLRADYVLPSRTLRILRSAVFWPSNTDPLFDRLIGTFPFPSSDHRLVWVDVK